MKFMFFILPSIPGTPEEREQLRPIARNNDRFQAMLDEVRSLAVMADDAGFDCFSTTNHHFHSEGYEASPAPLMLYADLAARTKQISFAPMALVLPAVNPIQVAEELALLDHLTKGRVYAGFARGYQQRWVNVFGQHIPVEGAPMDGGPVDNHNRKVHEECMEIIYKAWTNDVLQHDGEFWKVPYPYDTGIEGWPAAPWTQKYGAPGEIDANGVVRGVSVIPKPYQDPYPKAFQTFSVSESTIRYTAKEGIAPFILISDPDKFRHLCEVYQQVAADHGRDLAIGQSVGAFRNVHLGDTEEEAVARLEKTGYVTFRDYASNFGFWEAFRVPEDDNVYGKNPLPPKEWTLDRFRQSKFALAGTPDQVKREIEELHKIHGANGGELEWFGWWFDQGLMSLDDAKRQVEMFVEKIMPEFR